MCLQRSWLLWNMVHFVCWMENEWFEMWRNVLANNHSCQWFASALLESVRFHSSHTAPNPSPTQIGQSVWLNVHTARKYGNFFNLGGRWPRSEQQFQFRFKWFSAMVKIFISNSSALSYYCRHARRAERRERPAIIVDSAGHRLRRGASMLLVTFFSVDVMAIMVIRNTLINIFPRPFSTYRFVSLFFIWPKKLGDIILFSIYCIKFQLNIEHWCSMVNEYLYSFAFYFFFHFQCKTLTKSFIGFLRCKHVLF